jgi:hypothetical protein
MERLLGTKEVVAAFVEEDKEVAGQCEEIPHWRASITKADNSGECTCR